MKNKKSLSLILTLMIIVSLFYKFNYRVVNAATPPNPNPAPITSNGLTLYKTVAPVPGDPRSFDISLKVTGSNYQSQTDVVLVLDHSGSMKNSWTPLVTAANNLITKLGNNKNIRISVMTFDGVPMYKANDTSNYATWINDTKAIANLSSVNKTNLKNINRSTQGSVANDTQLITNHFSTDSSTIVANLNRVPVARYGGTDTEAAFLRVKEELAVSKSERPNADKYVVFFTDGQPSSSTKPTPSGADTTDTKITNDGRGFIKDARVAFDSIKNEAKFMTIGYTGNINSNIADAIKFMTYIQNTNMYSANSAQDLNNAFNAISNTIHTVTTIGKNVNVEDVVTDPFSIVDGSSKFTDLSTNQIKSITPNIDNKANKLNWGIGDLSSDGVLITFRVHVKDDYAYSDNQNTNVGATINYTDTKDNKTKNGKFPVPSVAIEPLKAKVTITKKVVTDNGVTVPKTASNNDSFSFTFAGGKANESYNLDLKNGETKSLDVDLKDSNTTGLKSGGNYLTIGDFNLKENNTSSNYELQDISINGQTVDKNHPKFTIDKDNKDVNIVVTNKYIPDPKKVKITVKKEVVTDTGVTAPSNDVFPISITGTKNNEKYILDLKGGESKSIEFYLKENNTTNNLHDLSYLVADTFNVNEIVPMNYKLLSIDHPNITVDANHTDITITIKNKYSNQHYLNDSKTVNNKLKLTN